MTDKVLLWCKEQGLLAPGDRVLLAISGGADSTAMLHLLLSLRQALGIELEAAHFNHRLRAAESDRDEAFCVGLCQDLGVRLHTGGADVAAFAEGNALGLEEAARKMRYGFLRGVASGAKIATAHNADDNLETMLMNLLRGCALRGLGGIPPKRAAIIRPLLALTRQEILTYLRTNGFSWVEDSSNTSPDFLRNRIRRNTLPALRCELPTISSRALETATALRADEDYLASCAEALTRTARRPGGYDCALLREAPQPLRLRALAQILRQGGGHDLSRAHLLDAEQLLFSGKPGGKLCVPGAMLRRQYALLTTDPADPAQPIAPQFLPLCGELRLPDGRLVRCARGVFTPGQLPYPNAFALQPALVPALQIRSRLSGDRLTGPGGTKSLKQWMIDCKIPACARAAVPVLTVNGRVVAAFGVAADPAFRAVPGKDALFVHLSQHRAMPRLESCGVALETENSEV